MVEAAAQSSPTTQPGPAATAGLSLRGVSKAFPSVQALKDVDLDVAAGSIHALLGHNGCGKSTLVKTLAGFHEPDTGHGSLGGRELILGSAVDAERAGIRFVHQELGLIPELSAVDNVGFVLGHEHGRFGNIQWRKQARKTEELLSGFGIRIDPMAPLAEATPVERTAVAIVRAVAGWHRGQGLLVLDEPTAALPAREVDELFRLIREVAGSGTAVLLISHRLDEVMQVCDHATVMRSGEVIWDGPTGQTSVRDLARLIAGAENLELEAMPRPPIPADAAATLKITDLHGEFLRGIDLTVHAGEIVGIAGLLGSGREELPYIVAGAKSAGVRGSIEVNGEPMKDLSVLDAMNHGVVLVPADRAHEGVFPDFTVRENVTLAALPSLRGSIGLAPATDRRAAERWLESVHADPGVSERPITTLSGGNQQKAVIARWLSVEPKVLALSEPTAGIDIGARTTIYEELRARADRGLAVLMSSSDAEDLLAVCDRVIVLRQGTIVAEVNRTDLTKRGIVIAMEGEHSE